MRLILCLVAAFFLLWGAGVYYQAVQIDNNKLRMLTQCLAVILATVGMLVVSYA